MNLHRMLRQRADEGRPLRIGLIGAGKFGSMYLSQARRTPGVHLVGVADLAPQRAKSALLRVGWPAAALGARSLAEAARKGTTRLLDDAQALIAAPEVEIVIDATAVRRRNRHVPPRHSKHVVMVNVEADALAGPLLARRARSGIVYYRLWRPAGTDLRDGRSARAAGFEVVAAGKGTKYLPEYHRSTPDTVWSLLRPQRRGREARGMNAQMFNSSLDGTKSAIEMAAVANRPARPPRGLPAVRRRRPGVAPPARDGGQLQHRGQVEVVSASSATADRCSATCAGAYVTFGPAIPTTCAGASRIRPGHRPKRQLHGDVLPYHLTARARHHVASVGLRREPPWRADARHGDVVATATWKPARRSTGRRLTVYGRAMPSADPLAIGGLPLGPRTTYG